jgi:predicted nucleotidyltransferase
MSSARSAKGAATRIFYRMRWEMTIGGGIRIRVLNLETQIAVKVEIGQEKDLAALPFLRHALEESRRKRGAE